MCDTHEELVIFSGNANPALARAVAAHLGVPLGAAEARFTASIMINSSMIERLTGLDVGWMMNTSLERTLSFSLTKMFSLLNENTSALPSGTPR